MRNLVCEPLSLLKDKRIFEWFETLFFECTVLKSVPDKSRMWIFLRNDVIARVVPEEFQTAFLHELSVSCGTSEKTPENSSSIIYLCVIVIVWCVIVWLSDCVWLCVCVMKIISKMNFTFKVSVNAFKIVCKNTDNDSIKLYCCKWRAIRTQNLWQKVNG